MLLAEWIAYGVVDKEPGVPPTTFVMWTPESLRAPPGSWVMFAFQLLMTTWSCCLVATFDSCYLVWMKAASFQLKTIRRTLTEQDGDRKAIRRTPTEQYSDRKAIRRTPTEQYGDRKAIRRTAH